MNSETSINLFEMEKEYVARLFIKQLFFYQFVNNFSALLVRIINAFVIFDISDFIQIFFISRSDGIPVPMIIYALLMNKTSFQF